MPLYWTASVTRQVESWCKSSPLLDHERPIDQRFVKRDIAWCLLGCVIVNAKACEDITMDIAALEVSSTKNKAPIKGIIV